MYFPQSTFYKMMFFSLPGPVRPGIPIHDSRLSVLTLVVESGLVLLPPIHFLWSRSYFFRPSSNTTSSPWSFLVALIFLPDKPTASSSYRTLLMVYLTFYSHLCFHLNGLQTLSKEEIKLTKYYFPTFHFFPTVKMYNNTCYNTFQEQKRFLILN